MYSNKSNSTVELLEFIETVIHIHSLSITILQ